MKSQVHEARRIGASIQVLTGQIKLPYSVPENCSKLATCALFLLSAHELILVIFLRMRIIIV